ncbi:prostaglandin D2 receptor 2 [Protopterus annectens]|uniref:prostaglandin D2 receptor 2 n=1 Tax=Protopterus annectens TaxID=7888 RepID=UPI001CFA88A5|nr:prostaglandin D2 receptor 2 [Protopterus annectens]XP_043939980.1 prostaglandin D2 receptor 2 [Protopterus annectens]XP_043939981.1 prostaglandin D2 receptor 2 [Protopterus annectens]
MDNVTLYCSIIEAMRQVKLSAANSSDSAIDYLSVCIHGIASFFGVLENGLIIWIVGFRMRKSVITTWILNLAVSDFMTTLSLPFFTYFMATGQTWKLGTFFCRVHSSIFFLNMFVSSFLLCAISIDRCVLIVYPVWSQNNRNEQQASRICAGLWVLAIINTLPYFLFRDTIPRYDGRIMCYYNFMLYSSPGNKSFELCGMRQYSMAISKFIIAFVMPVFIIAVCYTAVTKKIRTRNRKTPGRFFKLVVAIIITFVLCWFPYHIFSIMEAHAHYKMSLGPLVGKALPFVSSLAFINSIINPCLYVFSCPDFIAKFRTSIRVVLEHVLVEDTELATRRSTAKSSLSSDNPMRGYKFANCKDILMSEPSASN